MPKRAFNVDDWRWAEKTLLASVRLLGHSCVQADDCCHGQYTRWIGENVVAYDAANLAVGIVRLAVFQLPLIRRYLCEASVLLDGQRKGANLSDRPW